jgi:hypothetical protein
MHSTVKNKQNEVVVAKIYCDSAIFCLHVNICKKKINTMQEKVVTELKYVGFF